MSLDPSTGDPPPDEPPVESQEFLLRHFPNEPGEYDPAKKFIRPSVFYPRAADRRGLSFNREGNDDPFPTAKRLLTSVHNERVRKFGGVLAVIAAALRDLDLTIEITKGSLPGHVEILQLNREDYDRKEADGSQPGKQRIKALADQLVRLSAERLLIRIVPTPKE